VTDAQIPEQLSSESFPAASSTRLLAPFCICKKVSFHFGQFDKIVAFPFTVIEILLSPKCAENLRAISENYRNGAQLELQTQITPFRALGKGI
jgi:hypothetical protein